MNVECKKESWNKILHSRLGNFMLLCVTLYVKVLQLFVNVIIKMNFQCLEVLILKLTFESAFNYF